MADIAPIWQPSQERIKASLLSEFMSHLAANGRSFADYSALHQWSVVDSKAFWLEVWNYCDVIGSQGQCITGDSIVSGRRYCAAADTKWFPQAELNYAENCLSYAYQHPDGIALWFRNENGNTQKLTWQQLSDQVSIVQQWLEQNGVTAGDVVAGYLPYITESVVAMLATTSLGAIWTSISPDFGIDSVLERFGQVNPKVLFCCNGYTFGGKSHRLEHNNAAIAAQLPHLNNICQIEYLQQRNDSDDFNDSFSDWQAILQSYQARGIEYHRVSFNDPLFILYSSGTTGQPKCIVHSVGGTLLNHMKEHQLHCDIQPKDRVFYYTTCGWMMWNWHVSALASGATLIIYDGHPFYPQPQVLWQLAEETQTTLFGTSARYLAELENRLFSPSDYYSLNHLKTICSTGSPLYPEQYDFVYQHIKSDVHLASISGGTDICGCFVLGVPTLPVYRGECQSSALGADIAAYTEQGVATLTEPGELVCRNSFPNQPIGFWQDSSGKKYFAAYWQKFAGVWHHGDEIQATSAQGWRFLGRSDTMLNPGGVRIGTAEIYRQVNAMAEVQDSIAVGYQQGNDEVIALFVKLAPGCLLTDELQTKLRQQLKTRCSPRHVPAYIVAVDDVPRTRSGKLVEKALKQALHQQTITNMHAIGNPQSIDEAKVRFFAQLT